mmetsp:Transcript_65861/g.166842  ORF Transcript_65861/g.166842 Transcript_65861/m.166842 type:complete len:101 (-) Transcript_65861:1-303(-)
MANVAADQLSKEQKDELLCTYAALILHDDGAEVTPQAMTNLIKAAGCIVESYWPMLMTKMIKTVGGGDAGGAAGGSVGKAEAKKVVEEEEEEDVDFDLFG